MGKKVINQGLKKIPIFPSILFLAVIVISVGLFVFNSFVKNEIEELYLKIENTKEGIKDLKKDKNLQIALLLKENKSILNELEKRSQISKYINHIDNISASNGIKFSGFDMSDGKITTTAFARNKTDKILAYMNVKNFIKNYREDKKALFDLEFINSFDGMDMIKFDTIFRVK